MRILFANNVYYLRSKSERTWRHIAQFLRSGDEITGLIPADTSKIQWFFFIMGYVLMRSAVYREGKMQSPENCLGFVGGNARANSR